MPNFSVSVVGHVDSGKTATVKALSTVESTAAFDKHPESQRRGITLDVGFSKFDLGDDQVTLVDCPGHAAYIKTVLAGVGISDFIILVIDGVKMFQQQTYESLVLMELMQRPSIVFLNKIDELSSEKQEESMRLVQEILKKTKVKHVLFAKGSAKNGDVAMLREQLIAHIEKYREKILGKRQSMLEAPFIAQYDHCFQVAGVGSVFTSTILQGSVAPGQRLYLVSSKQELLTKQLQVFKQPVPDAKVGDRVGISVKPVDLLVERGLICQNLDQIISGSAFLAVASPVRHFTQKIKQGAAFGINFGFETAGARVHFFERSAVEKIATGEKFEAQRLGDLSYKEDYTCVILFEQPQSIQHGAAFIGLKLDCDKHCSRIAFTGNVVKPLSEGFGALFETLHTRQVELDVQRKTAQELVFRTQLTEDLTGMAVYDATGVQVGSVLGRFGQDKWKASLQNADSAGWNVQLRSTRPYRFE